MSDLLINLGAIIAMFTVLPLLFHWAGGSLGRGSK